MPKLDLIRELPSVEYLRECFDYEQETGELRWRVRPREHFARVNDWKRWNNQFAGTAAGYLDNGYYRVTIGSQDYKSHRIIWKLVTGEEPSLMLDHKDGDRANNCWSNLRLATYRDQMRNTKLRKDNVAGHRGVCALSNGRGWRATIFSDGVQRYLGQFNSAQEASVAYETAASELFGEFYRQPQEK